MGVNMGLLSSSFAPGNEMSEAVSAAALGAVRASVLPVKSCPGEIEDADGDCEQAGQHRRSLDELQPVALRPAAGSCAGERAGKLRFGEGTRLDSLPGTGRPPAESMSAMYSRQPAYSLREVPMVRLAIVS